MKTFFLFFLLIISSSYSLYAQESIKDLLPDDDCTGIEVSGEPEVYVGDDLFSLINGGAELYHEFGFVEVIAFNIIVPGADPIKAEIYDMGSPESAWGIYTMTATTSSEPVYAGEAGRRGEGYMQFIKGNYMVYIYFKNLDDTQLQNISSCISNKITSSFGPPELMSILNNGEDEAGKVVYFKGNLGLQSIYNFHYKDVFGYTEGAAAIYEDMKVFIFNYNSGDECLENYNSAIDFFSKSAKYHDQASLDGSFHMKDRKERQVDIYFEKTFLLAFVSSGEQDIDRVRERILKEMNK